jgi:hypothetical protein
VGSYRSKSHDTGRADDLKDEEINVYSLIYLLHCMDEFQGEGPIHREDKKCSGEQLSAKQLCRSFLDAICYLCDINRKGGTVTAAGLRQYYLRQGTHNVFGTRRLGLFYTSRRI